MRCALFHVSATFEALSAILIFEIVKCVSVVATDAMVPRAPKRRRRPLPCEGEGGGAPSSGAESLAINGTCNYTPFWELYDKYQT